MAELVWKGKRRPDFAHPIDGQKQAIPTIPYQLLTDSCHAASATEAGTLSAIPCENWANRLIFGDKCEVLCALLTDFRESVDLVYIDPTFMTGRTFNNGAELAYSDTWHDGLDGYLQWLYEALILLHALLTVDGSLYIHLDWRAVHYAKIILDEIFGGSPQD